MPGDEALDEGDMVGPIVQGRDVAQLLAAGRFEQFAVLDRDFLKRFEAVGGETRADHVNLADAVAGQLAQRDICVGFQPFVATKA